MTQDYSGRKAFWAAGEQARRRLTCPACGGRFDPALGRIRHAGHPDDCKQKILRLAEAKRRAAERGRTA